MIYLVYLFSFILAILKVLGYVALSWTVILLPAAIAFAFQAFVVITLLALAIWASK